MLAFTSSYVNLKGLSIFLFFSGCLFLLTFFWNRAILQKLIVKSDGSIHACYPLEEILVSYTIENHKWIPMIWLHFIQRFEESDCVDSPSDMPGGVRRLSKLLWYGKVSFSETYTGKHRGIYPISKVLIRSGDGFGLTQMEEDRVLTPESAIVVYPALCQVQTDLFRKNLWAGTSGTKGYVEDLTVLRGNRAYENRDSWKRIDWRSAARGQDLQTKVFETIKPEGVLFVLDGSISEERMEQAISIIASLVLKLEEEKILCGLALPDTKEREPVTILPGGRTNLECFNLERSNRSEFVEMSILDVSAELLTRLADFDAATCGMNYDTCLLNDSTNLPAQIYIVCEQPNALGEGCRKFMDQVHTSGINVVGMEEFL